MINEKLKMEKLWEQIKFLQKEYFKLKKENKELKKQNELLKMQNEVFRKDIEAANSCFETIRQKEFCLELLYRAYEKEHSEKCRLETEVLLQNGEGKK